MPAWPVRFAVEAAFIVGVAVLAWLVSLPTWGIVVVMAGAWLLVALVEWAISHGQPRPQGAPKLRRAARPRVPAKPVPDQPVEPPPVVHHVRVLPQEEARPPEPATSAPPVEAEPESKPEPVPEPVAPAAGAPGREQPQLRPKPKPEPAPVVAAKPAPPPVAAPQPAVAPHPTPAARPPQQAAVAPQEWNLWELERRARGRAGDDPSKDEEWAFLFVYLREFADPDGLLPAHFDNLVRESFADLIGSAVR